MTPKQSIKKDISKTRRLDGYTRPIPVDFWNERAVEEILNAAEDYVQRNNSTLEDFENDFELSSLMSELNKAINRLYDNRVHEQSTGKDKGHVTAKNPKTARQETDKITSPEWQCGQAVEEYLAREMRLDEQVLWFRNRLANKGLLTVEEAWDVLTHPLFRLLSFDDFKKLDLASAHWPGRVSRFVGQEADLPPSLYGDRRFVVPEHQSEDVQEREVPDRWGEYLDRQESAILVVEIDGPSGLIQRHKRVSPSEADTVFNKSFPVASKEEFFGLARSITDPIIDQHAGGIWKGQDEEEKEYSVRCWNWDLFHTVVGEAVNIAYHLIQKGWPIPFADALRFVFTDDPPHIEPISQNFVARTPTISRYGSAGTPYSSYDKWESEESAVSLLRAVLFVQPWVQSDALVDFWRNTRPAANRTLPLPHNVELFRFVVENTLAGQPFQWQSLAKKWNEKSGQRLSRGAVQTRFERTRDTLLPKQSE